MKTIAPNKKLLVTVVQNSAGRDLRRNLERIEQLLAKTPESDLVAMPEVFALRGSDADYRQAAESFPGPIVKWLAALARRRHSWILAGSIMERAGTRIFNTSVLIDRAGRLTAKYRKIHLFEAYLDKEKVIRERDVYSAGHKPVMVRIKGWNCGLTICYDLRFPELFRHYAGQGAHLFFVPSNFTQKTGKDHWKILLGARAIENQAFVIAPNQCGINPSTCVGSYGHSLALGPWGEVLGLAGDGECVFTVTLDPELIIRTRERIPVLKHRRLG